MDALHLNELYESGTPDDSKKYYKILSKYGITYANIEEHPFFGNFQFNEFEESSSNMIVTDSSSIELFAKPEAITKPEAKEPKFIPAMNWQAAAINGIATFMAGRFKQEVLHYGLENVFGHITSKDQEVIKGLFPKTYQHIEALYTAPENAYYTADLLYLKQLVHLDLGDLEMNFVKNAPMMFPKLKNQPNLIDGMALGAEIIDELQKETPLDAMLSRLSKITYTSDTSDVSEAINFLDLISMAFRDEASSDRTWVNPYETLPILDDERKNIVSTFFYGLLYQQLNEIPELSETFNELTNDSKLIAQKIFEIGRVVNQLNQIIDIIKQNNSTTFSINKSNALIEEFLNVIDDVSDVLDQEFKVANQRVHQATQSARDVLSIRSYLMDENYPLALAQIASIFGEYSNGSIEMSRSISFISGLAAIKNDDDMEKLLEAHALPIGSASIKRSSRFNLSINGYVGLTGGVETAFVRAGDPQQKGNIGLTAPIGISATFGKGHWTAFASFFDLGSVVNQRLNNDTTSYTNLRFEQFFTPGLGLYYNFKNAPISMGAHYCFIPNLRTVKYESGGAIIGESGVSVSRLNFSVLVDIPFFTIYNRTRKRRN